MINNYEIISLSFIKDNVCFGHLVTHNVEYGNFSLHYTCYSCFFGVISWQSSAICCRSTHRSAWVSRIRAQVACLTSILASKRIWLIKLICMVHVSTTTAIHQMKQLVTNEVDTLLSRTWTVETTHQWKHAVIHKLLCNMIMDTIQFQRWIQKDVSSMSQILIRSHNGVRERFGCIHNEFHRIGLHLTRIT